MRALVPVCLALLTFPVLRGQTEVSDGSVLMEARLLARVIRADTAASDEEKTLALDILQNRGLGTVAALKSNPFLAHATRLQELVENSRARSTPTTEVVSAMSAMRTRHRLVKTDEFAAAAAARGAPLARTTNVDLFADFLEVLTAKVIAGLKRDAAIVLVMECRDRVRAFDPQRANDNQRRTPAELREMHTLLAQARILLPTALATLAALTDTEISEDLPGTIARLRTAAQNDLESLPDHVDALLKNFAGGAPPDVPRYLLHAIVRAATDLTRKMNGPDTVADVVNSTELWLLSEYPPTPDRTTPVFKLNAAARTLAAISAALENNAHTGWIREADVQAVLQEFDGDRIALVRSVFGLLWAEKQAVIVALASSLGVTWSSGQMEAEIQKWADALMRSTNSVEALLALARNASRLVDKIQQDLVDLQTKNTGGRTGVTIPDFAPLLSDIGALLQLAPHVKDIFPDATVDVSTLNAVVSSMNNIAGVVLAVRSHDYRLAVTNALTVLENLPTAKDATFLRWLNTPEARLLRSLAAARDDASARAVLEEFIGRTNFMSRQLAATTLNASALFGVSAGYERLTKATPGVRNGSLRGGAFGPVGFDVAWGDASRDGLRRSGVFLSLIDVGALLSYRMQDKGELPPAKFSTVAAPGLFYVRYFKRWPVCLTVGTQYGPELRKVTGPAGATLEKAAWQPITVGFSYYYTIYEFRRWIGSKPVTPSSR